MKYEYMTIYYSEGRAPDLGKDDLKLMIGYRSGIVTELLYKEVRWHACIWFKIIDERWKDGADTDVGSNSWYERGDGPPVGTECEYTQKHSAQEVWYKCKVIAYDGGHPVTKTEKGYYHLRSLNQYLFRPLPTEEDKLVEQANEIVRSWNDSCGKRIGELFIEAGWRPPEGNND